MEKFFLSPDLCDKYILVQILNESWNLSSGHLEHIAPSSSQNELVINDNCNVFYAAKTKPDCDIQFMLKRKFPPNSSNGQLSAGLNSSFANLNPTQRIDNANMSHSSSSPMLKDRQFRSSFRTNSQASANRNVANNAAYFDELPPQSPSRFQPSNRHNSSNNSRNHNSSSSWQLFKKILS